jgi:hypothetical protein
LKSGKKKNGINVTEMWIDVLNFGGERTLEKDTRNIDMHEFDIELEIDPLFK